MEWILLGVAVILIAANGMFVAAEFSMITVERAEVERRAEAGERAAKGILAALRGLSTQLSGAQLGITLTSLIVGILAEPSLASLLSGPLTAVGLPEGWIPGISVILALILATGFQMVFAELVPKNIAIAVPYRAAMWSVPFQRAFTRSTRLIIRTLNGMANGIVRMFGVEPQEELASARSPQELRSLVRHSAAVGTLEAPTAQLLARSLTFDDRTAADVLTPRRQVYFLDAADTVDHAISVVQRTGHSRFPLVGPGGADDIVGMVGLRLMLRVPREQRSTTRLREVATRMLQVPESLPLDDLLTLLRNQGPMAVVVDEYGGTAGVVTLEDLVEELVGEVEDEHDVPTNRIRRRADGAMLVSGLVRPDELRELAVPAPESPEYETVGGMVMHELGRIAQVGDVAVIDGWSYQVTKMDGRRVDRVEITSPVPDEPDTDGDGVEEQGADGE